MNTITANELKLKGISVIENHQVGYGNRGRKSANVGKESRPTVERHRWLDFFVGRVSIPDVKVFLTDMAKFPISCAFLPDQVNRMLFVEEHLKEIISCK
jgi:hypothetical protein